MADNATVTPGRTIWLMAVTAGTVVANNYYNQPLLGEMAADLSISDQAASWIASATQIGYALGLLALLPLGDRVDRRRMISLMLCLSACMMVLFSLAGTYALVVPLGFLIGLTSIVPQILPPIASQIVPPENAPSAVGKVMAGLLLGIVLSRFVGGWLGDLIGWRQVYLLAAGIMIVLMIVLRLSLPAFAPTFKGSYLDLMGSLKTLFLRHQLLRSISFAAALQFGAFSLFWTTLAFHLSAMPGHYSARMAGTFALVGAVGVIGALATGRAVSRFSTRQVLVFSGALMLLAFVLFMGATRSLVLMVPAVILLDLGMQMSHVTSMSTILGIDRQSTSRLNTVYMVTRFAGGALGTVAGGFAWHYGGWLAVTVVGALFCLVALLINAGASSTAEGPMIDAV
ncbi:MFS transporter [Martelella sp. HB161492]|uniref:MFS transporter n=1 Tax=Martelella sp. HB161492 TaxID=2720726 RepID=UPI00158FFE64|nr:MFS transporter [Martelella sp. HB161492]